MRARSRYLAAGVLVLLPVGWPALVAPVTSAGSEEVAAEVALTFRDEAITESSGLVVRDGVVLTVNDSGDGPYLYAVDPGSGETTGVTTFADHDPVDVEALAPGPGGTVWVADIGDNARIRETIELYRFRPRPGGGRADAARFSLRYPDGPHDAETLLAHPRTGRLLVVTKRPVLGGEVYAVPRDLEPGRVHRLTRVATVPGMVTDGAFLPAGDRLVLRTYGTAAVHSYPDLARLTVFDLPAQEQGEALAVAPDGRVHLSTEGVRSDVLVMDLPAQASSGRPEGGPASGRAEAPAGDAARARPDAADDERPDVWRPARYGVVGAVTAGLVVLGLRAARRRGRRRR